MLVSDLQGVEANWNMGGKEVTTDARATSSLHKAARVILKKRFPTLQILEEVKIRIKRGKILYLDFYLPLRKLAIEVNGEQHYTYSSHFHTNRVGFLNSKRNDRQKTEWCDLNGIDLLVFRFDEQDTWGDQL